MTKTILQLGAGELMKHSIRGIQGLGHRVYAVDRNPTAPAFEVADGSAAIDLVDTDGITDYAREIGADAILAVNEAGLLAAAEASQRLGLNHISPEIALRALDKGLMREAWNAAGLSQPKFQIVDEIAKIPDAALKIGYPLILKPTRNWGSRGISRADTPSDLEWSMEFAGQHQRSGRFIVEQCVDGIEMTVEGLVKNGEVQILAKSDKEHQPHPRFRVAMGLNYPAKFPEAILQQTDELIIKAAQALGLNNCAIHAEVMVVGEEVYLIEMGARPGGGHIFGQIVEAASGVSMPRALAQILLGEEVNITPKHQHGAVYRFFAPPAGIFQSASGIEEAKALPGVLDFGFHLEPGTLVGAIEGDADRPGYCVTTGETREEAMRIADQAIATMRYEMA